MGAWGVIASLTLFAQDVVAPQPLQTAPPESADVTVTKGTQLDLIIDAPLDSKDSKPGDWFPIHLAVDLTDADGHVLLPAGTMGQGQVVHAAKAGFGGKAGELIVNARYLQCGATRVPLGHFNFAEAGKDRSRTAGTVSAASAGALSVPVAGAGALIAFMIQGGQVHVPAGTPALAKITADTVMTDGDRASCLSTPNSNGE